MRVRLLSTAERDLEDGFHFYESQSQDLGIYFLDSLFAEIDSLAFFGGIHPKFFGYHRLLSQRFPFAIYYRIIEKTVVVFAILDCRRNPSWTRARLTDS